MTPPDPHRLDLPAHWTPEQALAVFEVIELVRDHLWAAYGSAIQQAMREDLRVPATPSTPQRTGDPPF